MRRNRWVSRFCLSACPVLTPADALSQLRSVSMQMPNSFATSHSGMGAALVVSKSYAYKTVQKLKAERKGMDYLTVVGRVNKRYFIEKVCYGGRDKTERK